MFLNNSSYVHFPRELEQLHTSTTPNAGPDTRLTCSVSAFGYAGTIAHAVLSQPQLAISRGPGSDTRNDVTRVFASRRTFWWKSPETPILGAYYLDWFQAPLCTTGPKASASASIAIVELQGYGILDTTVRALASALNAVPYQCDEDRLADSDTWVVPLMPNRDIYQNSHAHATSSFGYLLKHSFCFDFIV